MPRPRLSALAGPLFFELMLGIAVGLVGTALAARLSDNAGAAGLQIRFPPSVFPVNSVKAMRGCLWLEPQGLLVPFAQAVFKAYWTDDLDISQDAVLAGICRGLGIDADAFARGIAEPTVKAGLKANTDEVIARGGFGSPTIYLDKTDMYFGNDRLPLIREALQRRQASAA